MLVEFRVKNFGCLRDETVLSFLPTKNKDLWETNVCKTNVPLAPQLLRTSVIYGPNAGGKSTLLHALQTMLLIIVNQTSTTDGNELPIIKFLFDVEHVNEPTEFEITFVYDNYIYQYGFSCHTDRIIEEYLFYYPKNRKHTLFLRTYDINNKRYIYKFSKSITGQKNFLCNATKDHTLFIYRSMDLNNKQLTEIWNELSSIAIVITKKNKPTVEYITRKIYEDKQLQKQICTFLTSADIDITDFKIDKIQLNNIETYELIFRHYDKKLNRIVELTTEYESDGTIQLYIYLPYIIQSLQKGSLLVIDELDSSLHPLLMRHIIDIFQSPINNPYGAQLLFTTHDVSLLQNEPLILRKDQIWFIEKNRDHASTLYSLSEFKNILTKDLARSYLHGRLGAIPEIYGWTLTNET